MSILKYIMKPFVEFREEPVPEPGAAGPAEGTYQKPVTVSYPPATPAAAISGKTADGGGATTYTKHFDDLIEEANAKNPLFQGTDFKEFVDSKIDVETIADDATRYKTAFNVLKRTGLTKERLVNTGQEYINIIDLDLKEFESAYVSQYKSDVAQKEQLLEQKATELKALNEKINVLNQEIKKISGELVQNKERLNANKNAFMQAGEKKRNELQLELEKIGRYF